MLTMCGKNMGRIWVAVEHLVLLFQNTVDFQMLIEHPKPVSCTRKLTLCYGSGSGRVRVAEGAREKSGSGSGADRKSFGADGKQKDLASTRALRPRAYRCPISEKLIRQKRKQGEPKSIFRLEIQEETPEYIY